MLLSTLPSRFPWRFAVVFLGSLTTTPSLAQVQLDRFYPPVVSPGREAIVNAEGKFPQWPVKIDCDRHDLAIVTNEKSGKLTVRVDRDAAPGIAWVRLFDDTSASNLVPLLVESMEASEEIEPNDTLGEATSADLPAVMYGRLDQANQVDVYRVPLEQGKTLVVSCTANRHLGSPMDAVVQLLDARGNVILQADDDRGIDPQLIYQAEQDGDVFVRLFAFPEVATSTIGFSGNASFVYTLVMTHGAFLDHVLPLVVPTNGAHQASQVFGWNLPDRFELLHQPPTNHSPQVAYAANSIGWQWQLPLPGSAVVLQATGDASSVVRTDSLPCIFSGHISAPGQVDRIRFPGVKSRRYEAVVHSRSFGFPLDSVLRVVQVDTASELVRNDDLDRNVYDAAATFTPSSDGELELQISDLVDGYGPRHAYSVVIREVVPSVLLTVVADHFAITAGQSLEIPIAVARLHGYDQELIVTAEGLPEGVQAEPVTSLAKGDSSKSVKLKLTASQVVADPTSSTNTSVAKQGGFRITAHHKSDQPSLDDPIATAHFQLRPELTTEHLWLTLVPEQR